MTLGNEKSSVQNPLIQYAVCGSLGSNLNYTFYFLFSLLYPGDFFTELHQKTTLNFIKTTV